MRVIDLSPSTGGDGGGQKKSRRSGTHSIASKSRRPRGKRLYLKNLLFFSQSIGQLIFLQPEIWMPKVEKFIHSTYHFPKTVTPPFTF